MSPKCHEMSPSVTRCHEMSRKCHGVSRSVTEVSQCHKMSPSCHQMSPNCQHNVTECHGMSQNVTKCHNLSPKCHRSLSPGSTGRQRWSTTVDKWSTSRQGATGRQVDKVDKVDNGRQLVNRDPTLRRRQPCQPWRSTGRQVDRSTRSTRSTRLTTG